MEGKVSQLAERLLKEGVEQGEKRKEEIIKQAEAQARDIMANAQSQAEKIMNEANQKAEEVKKSAESEIKLSGQQAVSALKNKITNLILAQAVNGAVSSSLEKNTPEYIKAVLSNWKGSDTSVEILLSDAQKTSLQKDIEAAAKAVLAGGVKISASKNIKSGFQVGEANGAFKMSFTDEDFAEYFKEYLRPKLKTILFGE